MVYVEKCDCLMWLTEYPREMLRKSLTDLIPKYEQILEKSAIEIPQEIQSAFSSSNLPKSFKSFAAKIDTQLSEAHPVRVAKQDQISLFDPYVQ